MESSKVELLKFHIRERGMSIKSFAENIGIVESTFYRKIDNDDGGFTVLEAQKITKLLALTQDESCRIFF